MAAYFNHQNGQSGPTCDRGPVPALILNYNAPQHKTLHSDPAVSSHINFDKGKEVDFSSNAISSKFDSFLVLQDIIG